MIVYNLGCEHEHVFEGWFASADAFEEQCGTGLVSCPVCGSSSVTRRLSAPHVHTGTKRTEPTPDPRQHITRALLRAVREAVRHSEDVGERFPEEARRIHYGETETRNIRGRASGEDLGELLEEGILVLPVPDEPELQ